MTTRYSLPGFGTTQNTGAGPQYPYPVATSHAQSSNLSSSYRPQSQSAASSSIYPHSDPAHIIADGGYDPAAPIPYSLSAHDPSLDYDPRMPNLLPPTSGLSPNGSMSNHAIRGGQVIELSAVADQRYQNEQITPFSLQRIPKSPPMQTSQNISDGELEEGELSEGGSQMSLDNESDIQVFHTQQTAPTASAADNISQRSIEDSLSLTKTLITEMFSWGLTFEDMAREVAHPEHLRASFMAAGLPVATTSGSDRRNGNTLATTIDGQENSLNGELPRLQSATAMKEGLPADLGNLKTSNTATAPAFASDAEMLTANGETKPLDRKALIAQKLAAKSVIARGSPATDRSNKESSVVAKEVVTPSIDNPAPTLTQPNESSSKSSADLEAQKKAQTELARRRMEALKQKLAEKEMPSQAPQLVSIQASPSEHRHTPTALVTDIEPPNSVPPRKSSYFSPVSQTQLFSIPGLMAAPNNPDGEDIQPVPHRTSEPAAPKNSSTDNAQSREFHALPPKPAVLSVSNNATSVPESAPRTKRPEASDFIDVVEVPVRKADLTGDAGVIIDISDEESDDDGEHEEGPLSDLLPTHKAPHTDASPPQTAVVDKTRPAVELQRPHLISSTSASVTPKALATPRGQEDEDLRSKELKIQSLTRKIAEMEAKRQGKKDKAISSDSKAVHPAQVLPVSQSSEVHGPANAPVLQAASGIDLTSPSATTRIQRTQGQIGSPESADFHRDAIATSGKGIDGTEHLQSPNASLLDMNNQPSVDHDDMRLRKSSTLTDRNASRCKEIEVGIPLLVKEIERARQKLSIIKQQERELEAEIQTGLDGKQMLMNELRNLLSTTEGLTQLTQHSATDSIHPLEVRSENRSLGPNGKDTTRESLSVDAKDTVPSTSQTITPLQTQIQSKAPPTTNNAEACQGVAEPPSNEQGEDIIMDISQSELDDGEIEEHSHNVEDQSENLSFRSQISKDEDDGAASPDSLFEDQQEYSPDEPGKDHAKGSDLERDSNDEPSTEPVFDFDNEELYEPVADVEIDEPMELESDHGEVERSREASSDAQSFDPLFDDMEITDDRDDGLRSEEIQDDDASTGSEEEYEPPEPHISGAGDENTVRSASRDPKATERVQTPQEVEADKPQEITQLKRTYFTPYESPLKDFRSRNPHTDFPSTSN